MAKDNEEFGADTDIQKQMSMDVLLQVFDSLVDIRVLGDYAFVLSIRGVSMRGRSRGLDKSER